MEFIYNYLDRLPYEKSVKLMEEKFTEAVQQKKCFVFFLEHDKIYTAGLKTLPEHILGNIEIVKSRRGGSVTVHSQGQLILYAVFPLSSIDNDLEKYIRVLEECIIKTLKHYEIESQRHPEHTGVFTNKGKIAFIGIGAKKGAAYHGAALNVHNDLKDYDPILSCGLDLPVTSMLNEKPSKSFDLRDVSLVFYDVFLKKMKESFKLNPESPTG